MPTKELDREMNYGSFGQRIARIIHLCKARFESHERNHVNWLGQYLGREGVIIDASAQFGYFSKEFARLNNGHREVHAFEPLPYNFGILESVTSGMRNVAIYCEALSDCDGTAELQVPVKTQGKIGPGLAHFGEESSRDYIRHTEKTIMLDSFVRQSGIPGVAFIKLDVESAELLVLRGAHEVLSKSTPPIYLEVNPGRAIISSYPTDKRCRALTTARFTAQAAG